MSIIYFLLVLSILVLIHEAGHYFTARLFGIKAEEFGYGFPPRFLGFVKDKGRWKRVSRKDRGPYANTIWSLNWLPLGGFVRIKGEQNDGQDDADSFHRKPIWQRAVVLAAGVFMNWLLAFVLFIFVFSIGTTIVLDELPKSAVVRDRSVQITQILPESPADKAGLLPGDRVISIAGKDVSTFEEGRKFISDQGEASFAVRIERNGIVKDISATPEYLSQLDRAGLGVGLADVGVVSFTPVEAVKVAAISTYGYTKAILFTFADLLKNIALLRPIQQEVSGPVGIAVITGKIAEQGIVPLLQFAAVLSINLAIINFLPIPALDGGRVLFLAIEKLRRRAMSHAIESAIHNVAFLLLLSLILLVTVRDISTYGMEIVGGIKGLVGY